MKSTLSILCILCASALFCRAQFQNVNPQVSVRIIYATNTYTYVTYITNYYDYVTNYVTITNFVTVTNIIYVTNSYSGSIYTANSPSAADVQAQINLTKDGDMVIVPAGNGAWGNPPLLITNSITLKGAGTNNTFIWDNTSPINRCNSGNGGIPFLTIRPDTNAESRLTGFTFIGTNLSTDGSCKIYNGEVYISGKCFETRVDSCHFTNLWGDQLLLDGWEYGVVDHCEFEANFEIGVEDWMSHYGDAYNAGNQTWADNTEYGDSSWADNELLGSTNVLCIENCYFNDYTPDGGPAANALDCYNGSRIVFRYNLCTNTAPTTHGTESSGRSRGFRTLEIYQNTFVGENPGCYSAGEFRGGTGLIYSNTYSGTDCGGMMAAVNYRSIYDSGTYWGGANGVNAWDSNSTPQVVLVGTCSSTNQGLFTMTDTSKSWTINQWLNYTIVDTNTQFGSFITSNSVNTIFFVNGSSIIGINYLQFTNGEPYQLTLPLIALDQPGRGKGDLIVNGQPVNSITGLPTWPHEAIEPIYAMSNTVNNVLEPFASSYPTVQSGRDYYNGLLPNGYIPLTYPHPLDH